MFDRETIISATTNAINKNEMKVVEIIKSKSSNSIYFRIGNMGANSSTVEIRISDHYPSIKNRTRISFVVDNNFNQSTFNEFIRKSCLEIRGVLAKREIDKFIWENHGRRKA